MHIDGVHWRGTEASVTVQTTGQFLSREPHVWAMLCTDEMILRCEIAGSGFMKSCSWLPEGTPETDTRNCSTVVHREDPAVVSYIALTMT